MASQLHGLADRRSNNCRPYPNLTEIRTTIEDSWKREATAARPHVDSLNLTLDRKNESSTVASESGQGAVPPSLAKLRQ